MYIEEKYCFRDDPAVGRLCLSKNMVPMRRYHAGIVHRLSRAMYFPGVLCPCSHIRDSRSIRAILLSLMLFWVFARGAASSWQCNVGVLWRLATCQAIAKERTISGESSGSTDLCAAKSLRYKDAASLVIERPPVLTILLLPTLPRHTLVCSRRRKQQTALYKAPTIHFFSMHYAILPLLSLAFATLSNAVPVVQRDVARLSESEPWKLSNIRVIEAKDGTRVHSSVSFDIVDINRGLEFSTSCSYSVSPDSDEDLEKPGWRKCGLKFVDFQYTGDKIEIRRYYKDPA